MFCHLTLQGKAAPKREPEVSLTSSQSRLSSSLLLVKEGGGGGGGGKYRFMIRNSGEAHSSVATLICLLRRIFFFRIMSMVLIGESGALRPGKQRSGIGWGSLMPLVK